MNDTGNHMNTVIGLLSVVAALIITILVGTFLYVPDESDARCELCGMFPFLINMVKTESEHDAYDLACQSEKLQVVRQVTFLNTNTNDMMFRMTGRISIEQDTRNKQLEITVKNEDDTLSYYQVGLNDTMTYIVENKEINYTKPYPFTILYHPDIQFPVYTQISEKE